MVVWPQVSTEKWPQHGAENLSHRINSTVWSMLDTYQTHSRYMYLFKALVHLTAWGGLVISQWSQIDRVYIQQQYLGSLYLEFSESGTLAVASVYAGVTMTFGDIYDLFIAYFCHCQRFLSSTLVQLTFEFIKEQSMFLIGPIVIFTKMWLLWHIFNI